MSTNAYHAPAITDLGTLHALTLASQVHGWEDGAGKQHGPGHGHGHDASSPAAP
jgi:hypothetical protein